MSKKKLFTPDIIIVSSLSLLTILNGFLMKRRYKCRLIFEIRDIWPLTITETGSYRTSNLFIKILAFIERFGYNKSDAVVGTMPNLKEHVQKIVKAPCKCYCIPQGVDIELFSDPEPLPFGYAEKYLPSKRFIVVYMGSIGRTNALETLLECAKALQNNRKVHFLLVGNGDMLENFKIETAKMTNITFAPKVKKSQVQTILQKCDLTYDSAKNTKLYQYGLSRNKWIDYLFAAKPLVASYSGFKSIINEANCGTFVPPENVKELTETILYYSEMDKNTIESIGNRGKRWLIRNRSFKKLALDYYKICKELQN